MNKFFIVCLMSTAFLASQPQDHDNFKNFGSKEKDDYNDIEYIHRQTYKISSNSNKASSNSENSSNSTSTTTPSITTITEPIIIDTNNADFKTQSCLIFTENIIYNPSSKYNYPKTYTGYEAAIIVAKDNITIDFSGFSLILDPSVTTSPIIGISVLPGVRNLKIISGSSEETKKGSISGFTSFAIYMLGTKANPANVNGYDTSIICPMVENLHMMQNQNGIYIGNAIQPEICGCCIYYNNSIKNLVYGVYLSNVIDGLIENCNINMCSSSMDVYGIYLNDSTGSILENNKTSFNRSTNGNAIGINITGTSTALSSENKIINCKSNGNICAYAEKKESIGICINSPSAYNIIENNSTYKESYANLTNANPIINNIPKTYGIKINNSSYNQLFNNKSGYNNYGFYDSTKESTSLFFNNLGILNTIANYYIFIGNSLAFGYLLPLPTIIIHQDLLSSHDLSNSITNLEVR